MTKEEITGTLSKTTREPWKSNVSRKMKPTKALHSGTSGESMPQVIFERLYTTTSRPRPSVSDLAESPGESNSGEPGTVFSTWQFPESLQAFDQALALAQSTGLAKEEADWHKGKGNTLFRQGRYTQALDSYRLAIRTYAKAGLKRELVEALLQLGEVGVSAGRHGFRRGTISECLRSGQQNRKPQRRHFELAGEGGSRDRRKQYAQAASLYRRALMIARENKDDAQVVSSLLQIS